ncbi:MAG: PKD domain-containing protein [Bacteroidales bacterium]|nr:PKD domain-containing protein [Bacteroidales bacterium]
MTRKITMLFGRSLVGFLLLLVFHNKTNGQTELFGMTSEGGNSDYGTIFRLSSVGTNHSLIYSFDIIISGANPEYTHLCEAANGKLYGMTWKGDGGNGGGVIFEYDPETDNYTEKYAFNNSVQGYRPKGSLMQAGNGMLYGMTIEGGLYNNGVIFEYDPISNTYIKLFDFDFTNSGCNPSGNLLLMPDGTLWGLTMAGGAYFGGTIFKYDPANNVFTKKHDFNGTAGNQPRGGLVEAGNGLLYGLSYKGGTYNYGVLFEFDPITDTYVKKIDFNGSSNGRYPIGSMILASDGLLYGLTSQGGTTDEGVIFKYNPLTSSFSKEKNLSTSIGSFPMGSLFQSTNGKLYGLTPYGGANDEGVLFEYDPLTSAYIKKFDFNENESGKFPKGSLFQASNGFFYGMTNTGGTGGYGTLFEYNLLLDSCITKVNLGSRLGIQPYGGLTRSADGKIFGMTVDGGKNNSGVIFEINLSTGVYRKVHDFIYSASNPKGDIVQANNGKFYGMTYTGGNGHGALFEFDPISQEFSTKVYFDNYTNGSHPIGSLLLVNNKLYGMTPQGGAYSNGVLFEYDPFSETFTKLVDFGTYATNSSNPQGSLIQAINGKLYGTAYGGDHGDGVIFEFDLDTYIYTNIFHFDQNNGRHPCGKLLQSENGNFYGMTKEGGSFGSGVVFEFNPITKVYFNRLNFDGANGSYPYGDLTQASNGMIYGMTNFGGANNLGVLFKYNRQNNTFEKILDFDGINGARPYYGGLIEIGGTEPLLCATLCTPNDLSTGVIVDTSLHWNSIPEADAYLLSFGTDNPPTNIFNSLNVGSDTIYNLPILLDFSQKYYWQVTPYNATDTAFACNIWSFTTTEPIIADFTAEDTIQINSKTDFTDLSTGSPTFWQWTFEGGTPETSTEQNPDSIFYYTAGSYNVTLFTSNPYGADTLSIDNFITVNAAPVADFEPNITYISDGGTVYFTDLSANNPASWAWDFDGDTIIDSNDQDPSWTYTEAGTFTVSLTVSDGLNENTQIKTDLIVADSMPIRFDVPGEVTTIQAAIDASSVDDTVLVQPGTYFENIIFRGKSVVVGSMFINTGDTSFISQTIIDGANSARVVRFIDGEDSTAALIGFKIINGLGGISLNTSSPVMSNLLISGNIGNYYGAGINIYGSSNPRLNDIIITGNSGFSGGGLAITENSNPQISNMVISNNSASNFGGGVYVLNSDEISISGIKDIVNNSSLSHGGGIYIDKSDIVLEYADVSYNTVPGAIVGGGIYINNCSPIVRNNTIDNNSSNAGGGLYIYQSNAIIYNNVIKNNYASANGGGIFLNESSPAIANNLIFGNWSDNPASGAGGIRCYNASPIFINNTIVNNSGTYGGGLRVMQNSNPVLINNIFWGNTATASGNQIRIDDDNSDPDFQYCDIEGDTTDFGIASGAYFTGIYANCINSYPQFQDTITENFKLKGISPCVDAGIPDTTGLNLPLTDLDGNQRIISGIVDIGCFEFISTEFLIDLNCKVFLQGPFTGSEMLPYLNFFNYIPLSQPYDNSPWYYYGSESVAAIPNNDVVDWVLVELRDTTDATLATSATILGRQAAFLLKDGSVVGMDGSSNLTFSTSPITDSLFVVIWHRNHVSVISAYPLSQAGGVYSYDFSSSASQAYGTSLGHKEIAAGIWGMIASDGNGDSQVNNSDKNDVWAAQAGTNGYLQGDFSMDGQVNNTDKNELWKPNTGLGGQVPQ